MQLKVVLVFSGMVVNEESNVIVLEDEKTKTQVDVTVLNQHRNPKAEVW